MSRIPFLIPALVMACLLAILASINFYRAWESSELKQRSVEKLRNAAGFSSSLATAHLWLEEGISSGSPETLVLYASTIERNQQVWVKLWQSINASETATDGEWLGYKNIREISRRYDRFIALGTKRLQDPNHSTINSPIDQEFDQNFQQLMQQLDVLDDAIYIKMTVEHQQRLFIRKVTLLLSILVLILSTLAARNFLRQKKEAMAKEAKEAEGVEAIEASEKRFRAFFEQSSVALKEEDHSSLYTLLKTLTESERSDIRSYLQQHPEFLRQCSEQVLTVDVNHAALEMHGFSDKQQFIRGSSAYFYTYAQHAFIERIVLLLNGKRQNSRQVTLKNKQGVTIHAMLSVAVVSDHEQDWSSVIISLVDVSAQIQAKERLKRSELHLQRAQSVGNIGSWELDAANGSLQWSKEVFRIFGLAEDVQPSYELFTKSIHPDDRERVALAWQDHIELDMPYIVVHRTLHADGRLLYVQERCQTTRDEHGKALLSLGTVQDISRLVQAEQEGRLLQDVLSASPDLIGISDQEQNLLYANQALRSSLDLDGDTSLQGVKISAFYNEEELVKVREQIFPQVMSTGLWHGEVTLSHHEKGEILASQIMQAHHDSDGKCTHISMIARDITVQKQQQKKLEHTQRLEGLGVLAGGIAHDFNNLLSAIMGHASMAQSRYHDHLMLVEHLKSIEQASNSAADLCLQMLAYSGKGKFLVKPINLSNTVHEMGRLLEVSIAKNVSITYELGENLPLIEGDFSQIQQVIMNLVINASESISEEAGAVVLTTGIIHANAEQLYSVFLDEPLELGEYVYLKVSDTGCGMDEAVLKRLFEPFFTTKFTGRGLGMSAILGIIRGHHGTIKIDSQLGKGTTFEVLLPAMNDAIRIEPIDQDKLMMPTELDATEHRGTVLIVDDEEAIRQIASLSVQNLGFSVIHAEDGMVAIEKFKQHQKEISCVLLDMTMPRMGGQETFAALLHINPELKVILSSGYSEQIAIQHFSGKTPAAFIQKPYTPKQLQQQVIQILQGAAC